MEVAKLFHNYRDPEVDVCTGTRYKDDRLPGPELDVIEHVAARTHCMRIWGDQSLAETVQKMVEDGRLNQQIMGGLNNFLWLAVVAGLWGDEKFRNMPTVKWLLREIRKRTHARLGLPIWPDYPQAAIEARLVAGADRFNPVVGLRPSQTSTDDVLDITVDNERDINPKNGLPVMNWPFEYIDRTGTVRSYPLGSLRVETLYSNATSKPEVIPTPIGPDLTLIVSDQPFGGTGVKLCISMGGRGGGTIGAALLQQHLVERSDERTAKSFSGIFENTMKRPPTPEELALFLESVNAEVRKIDEMFANVDPEGVTGAVIASRVKLVNNMPVQFLEIPAETETSWVKRHGEWIGTAEA